MSEMTNDKITIKISDIKNGVMFGTLDDMRISFKKVDFNKLRKKTKIFYVVMSISICLSLLGLAFWDYDYGSDVNLFYRIYFSFFVSFCFFINLKLFFKTKAIIWFIRRLRVNVNNIAFAAINIDFEISLHIYISNKDNDIQKIFMLNRIIRKNVNEPTIDIQNRAIYIPFEFDPYDLCDIKTKVDVNSLKSAVM